MPLRDHFHPPWSEENEWEGFHSAWVNTMVRHLNGSLLPPNFRAIPKVHLGSFAEFPDQDVIEVRIQDDRRERRLVAVVELVSPSNKDRAGERKAFVEKCAAYLRDSVSVVVVDLVTSHHANLHQELLELIGMTLYFTRG